MLRSMSEKYPGAIRPSEELDAIYGDGEHLSGDVDYQKIVARWAGKVVDLPPSTNMAGSPENWEADMLPAAQTTATMAEAA